uniref:(northern house mosquito) hypothetical protein n=1 Tax=Culex pipiens TaxID=7175 RepID=A0A8D8N212_CULPI
MVGEWSSEGRGDLALPRVLYRTGSNLGASGTGLRDGIGEVTLTSSLSGLRVLYTTWSNFGAGGTEPWGECSAVSVSLSFVAVLLSRRITKFGSLLLFCSFGLSEPSSSVRFVGLFRLSGGCFGFTSKVLNRFMNCFCF